MHRGIRLGSSSRALDAATARGRMGNGSESSLHPGGKERLHRSETDFSRRICSVVHG